MSFSFLFQELQQRVAEKMNAVKAHKKMMAIVIAAVLIPIVLFAVKTNLAQSPAVGTAAPAVNTTQNAGSAAKPNGGDQNETAMQAKTLKRIENVASILGVAVLTSGGMLLYYRKKQNQTEPLPVLRSEEGTH